MHRLESHGAWRGTENPRVLYVAQWQRPAMTHALSSRQLPTTQYHASLSSFPTITREYQTDSPSQQAGPMGFSIARDGPSAIEEDHG